MDITQLLEKINRVCMEHLHDWSRRKVFDSVCRWTPPHLGLLKVNFNMAMRDDFAVGAAVIQDHMGQIVGVVAQEIQVKSPLEVKSLLPSWGLKKLREGVFKI